MFDNDDIDLSATPAQDIGFNALLAFIVLFVIVLAFINPVAKNTDAEVKMPGNIMVAIRWPDNVDVDVDLWVKAPGDSAIGYSNRAGNVFNLLRDDLGTPRDSTPYNYELAFGRGMPDGDYTVNVHLFRNGSQLTEIPVDALVYISQGSVPPIRIAQKKVVLKSYGEEITIVNFEIKQEKFTGVSNNTYTPLRNAPVVGDVP
ncbi:MAG: hypothetical protein Q7S52_02705 [bacterium]|nr:hypothetical protein [bacterium]